MSKMNEMEMANYKSHYYGIVDDCYRCVDCEVGVWNGHKEMCWTAGVSI